MTDPAKMLIADQVSVNFGGLQALLDVRLEVEEGEVVALIGPNGAGKTTLLNVLTGNVTASAGTVTFRGESMNDLPTHVINARGIGRTFQAVELLAGLSVRENVMAGGVSEKKLSLFDGLRGWGRSNRVYGDLEKTADELLEFVGLKDHADEDATVLPAGQQRLLGIARAMATGADLLFLDEPGAGLNETEKGWLIDVIRKLSTTGKTVVFVEHDMGVVGRLAERIVVLDRGKVIAEGKPEVVRNDQKVIEAYLGVPKPPRAREEAPDPSLSGATPLLDVGELEVAYGGLIALKSLSLKVYEGEIIALVGANGAGKSTFLKSVSRVVNPRNGHINFDGENLMPKSANQVVGMGITLAPEGRELFPSLSVLDNLALGRYTNIRASGFHNLFFRSATEKALMEERLAQVYELFPILKERREQLAGTLSGGQGQMLAIGRALMSGPRLLMLDEPSLGLAPQVVAEIMLCLDRLRGEGYTILLVEQNAQAALEVADRGYVLATGAIAASGSSAELLRDHGVSDAYLGWTDEANKSTATETSTEHVGGSA
jgi:branched-chain amino acid transport system ATP-binding protein